MRNRRWQQVLTAVVVLALGHSAFAAVVFVSQERKVEVQADANNQSENDTQSAPDAGEFNGTASVDLSGEGFFGRVSSSMNSVPLEEEGFSFTGDLSYEVQDTRLDQPDPPASFARATAELTHIIEFRLDRAYDFILTGDREVLDDDPGQIGDLVTEFSGEDGMIEGPTGTLEAGTYTLTYATRVEGVVSNAEERTYAEQFFQTLNLSPAGGNGGGPNPIPLPPGVWAGGAMLAAMALGKARKALGRTRE